MKNHILTQLHGNHWYTSLNVPNSLSITGGSPAIFSVSLALSTVKAVLGTRDMLFEEEQAVFGGIEGRAGWTDARTVTNPSCTSSMWQWDWWSWPIKQNKFKNISRNINILTINNDNDYDNDNDDNNVYVMV